MTNKTLILARALGYVAHLDTTGGYGSERVIAGRPGAPAAYLFNPRHNLHQFAEVLAWMLRLGVGVQIGRNCISWLGGFRSWQGKDPQRLIAAVCEAAEELASQQEGVGR